MYLLLYNEVALRGTDFYIYLVGEIVIEFFIILFSEERL